MQLVYVAELPVNTGNSAWACLTQDLSDLVLFLATLNGRSVSQYFCLRHLPHTYSPDLKEGLTVASDLPSIEIPGSCAHTFFCLGTRFFPLPLARAGHETVSLVMSRASKTKCKLGSPTSWPH